MTIRFDERFREEKLHGELAVTRTSSLSQRAGGTGCTDVYVQEFNLFLRRNYRAKLFLVASGLYVFRPLLGNTAGLISCLFHLPLLLFATPPVRHRSIRQAPGNFVRQQPTREKRKATCRIPLDFTLDCYHTVYGQHSLTS